MLLILLVVLLALALVPGISGPRWGWGSYYGWSPFGIIVLLIILALLFGWHL